MIVMTSRLSLLLLLLLASCGDLPEPFLGNPGVVGRQIRAAAHAAAGGSPTDQRAAARRRPAGNSLTRLQAASRHRRCRRCADRVHANDWQLVATAGNSMTGPWCRCSRVLNPKGEDKGHTEGSPVPTAAWAAATPATLGQTAIDAAPKITKLLTGIQHADPNSLSNRHSQG